MAERPAVKADELLEALSDCAVALLEAVAVPAYIVDNDLRVRWQNAASRELVGDLRGRLELNSKVVPEDLDRARDAFTQKQSGAEHTSRGRQHAIGGISVHVSGQMHALDRDLGRQRRN